jgi:mRNA interferase MazF
MLTEIYKPYDVIAVPFPFTDKHQTKRRPAVVLSSIKHQKETGHCSLLMITSASNKGWVSDLEIQNLEEAGLSHDSVMRQKIFTIDSRLIARKIGRLHLVDSQRLKETLIQHLSI